MNNIIDYRINIGVSACQNGAKVRYNAKGFNTLEQLTREKFDFSWHPVCPEVAAGLGVPRMPIKLVNGNGFDFWEKRADVKNKIGHKINMEIKEGCLDSLKVIKRAKCDVFIYMDGSPTCGVYRTTLKNKRLGHPPGTFGALLLQEEIFLIPANDLNSPIKWWDHRRRMLAYIWLKNLEVTNKNEMYDFWHILKFLIQEINRKKADEIGHTLANMTDFEQAQYDLIRSELLNLLREQQPISHIKQSLYKNYKYAQKKYNLVDENILDPSINRGSHKMAEELLHLEREFRDLDIVFGPSPIMYKSPRF